MSAVHKLITDHLDIWTAADTEKKSGRGRASGNANSVYGIKKLRELILELAVRGKLVPQDPNDEPASELLKRIQDEKAKLAADGKIKKDKPLAANVESENPFDLAYGWEWVRFNDIVDPAYSISYGVLVPGSDEKEGIPFVRIADLDIKNPPFKPEKSISREIDAQYERTRLEGGEILMGVVGSIGKLGIAPESWKGANIARAICRIKVTDHVCKAYVALLLQSRFMQDNFIGDTKTLAQPTLNIGLIRLSLTPLAPIKEQHRIVAKVDELMALCDQLEAQHNNAADAHEQLVSHLLSTLTQSQDAEDFNANWQRIATHFDTLFTTESSIDALKQTLLQLAVMGKLVPQDPNDEPANELLKRIQVEKAKLVAEGRSKKGRASNLIIEEDTEFALPHGWQWARLEMLGMTCTGRTPSTQVPAFYDGVIPFIGPGQITPSCELLPAEKCISEVGKAETSMANIGDILMVCIGGSIGKSALVDKELGFNQQINCLSPILVESKYVHIAMMTNSFQSKLIQFSSGSATPIINKSKWEELLVPVAPLSEQRRIVLSVLKILSICDQLRSNIVTESQKKMKIAEILVRNTAR
ncbi:restriction endonuclease subunit S [Undibacterium aquatile]|uniref:Restriction endonuclease subunit S n=1 Tax=Undibacterium aquatile TaxID=1537398 RepID=A0ABR6XDA9_9BURK|nr:restriction endonuclease subunit S [Undibacterium aquatile]MBC3810905.1 restriction endonuclease subunit S [Undibacterium aquatile]